MNEVIRNKYILEESKEDSILKSNDEIELNLKLTPSINYIKSSTIEGNILDEEGKNITNAIVKLESLDKKFKAQAITNSNGRYVFEDVMENFYTLSIWSNNMLVKRNEKFQVIGFMSYNMDFTLKKDENSNTSIITGDVFDSTDNTLIYNVVVMLFEIQQNGERTLKSIAYTNEFGQFAFRKILNGEYFLVFNMHGYIKYFTNISIIKPSQISSLKINMIPDEAKINKTISGAILDSSGNPVKDVFVYLYFKSPNDKKEKIIKVTKTNEDGVYVFIDIPKGSYRVMYAN